MIRVCICLKNIKIIPNGTFVQINDAILISLEFNLLGWLFGHGILIGRTLSCFTLCLLPNLLKTKLAVSLTSLISDISDLIEVLDNADPRRLLYDATLEGSWSVDPYISVSGPIPILCSAQSAPAFSSSSDIRNPKVNFSA